MQETIERNGEQKFEEGRSHLKLTYTLGDKHVIQ